MPDNKSFISTIEKHKALIYKVACFYTADKDDRDDLLQEIIYQLWRSFDSFDGNSAIITWMYRVAMNTAIYYSKKEKRRVPTQAMDDDMPVFVQSEDNNLEERLNVMHTYIDRLDLLEKGIMVLYLEDKSYEEIGKMIGLSTTNVGTRIARIKEKLRKQIIKN